MESRFHPIADAEYWKEVLYYHKISTDLGERFEKTVGDVIQRLENNPYLCHNRGDGVYSVRVKNFPFSIFYEIYNDEILITSFFMEIRDPEIWKSRKGIL